MNRLAMLFKERYWVWLVPLAFVVSNLGLLTIYRTVYAGRVEVLEQAVSRESGILARLQQQRERLDDLHRRAAESREGIETLYHEHFSTKNQRLTDVIREVERLARSSGLLPDAVSYPEQEIADYDLVKKSFVFTVVGDYVSLRKFINFLELSDSFLVLEGVNLNETGGADAAQLSISLNIATLFSQRPAVTGEEPEVARGERSVERAGP